ncbi:MAG: glycosyltransferase family 39 protein, partial [Blastocatellia bacterium]
PRDYNTVPRVYFWLFHLIWLFPWSLYLPAVFRLDYRSPERAARVRLLCACWIGFVLIFFSLSTSQEYYTMPCYPAFAILIGSALASSDITLRLSTRLAGAISIAAFAAIAVILYMVRQVPTPGDISAALTEHPAAYTLSLGHMEDLTVQSFAYLRLPLIVAAIACAIGAIGTWRWMERKTVLSLALAMTLFFHAARLAMVSFDPYLSSRPLADSLLWSPKGTLIVDDPYWEFSSVFFYTNSTGLLLNGRRNNLEYGSYAPGAPSVFISDSDLARIWNGATRCYLLTEKPNLRRIQGLLGAPALREVKESGGKYLFSNQ